MVKLILYVVAALFVMMLLYWAISAALGYLMIAGTLAMFGLIIAGLVRLWLSERGEKRDRGQPSLRKAERSSEKMLRRIEKTERDRQ